MNNVMTIPDANHVKAKVVEYFLSTQRDDIVIASELQFADFKRRVDLVVITDNLLAIEIKSPRDNLVKLSTQVADYNDYFDGTAIVCDNQLTSKVRDIVPGEVGIYEFDNALGITKNRAEQYESVDTRFLITFLVRSELRGLAQATNIDWKHTDTVDALRRKIADLAETSFVRDFVISALRERLRPRFANFARHRGTHITDDDLFYLTVSPLEKYRFR